jgi:hypothetical protein
MAKQILDNIKLQNNLDWFHFETAIRKEVHALLVPFKEELKQYKDLAHFKYHFLDKVDERVQQLEDYAQIETKTMEREEEGRLQEGEIGP